MLYNKCRAKKFSAMLGCDEIVESIKQSLGEVHTYLLHGTRGCGKTTLARIIARELKVGSLDRYEIDGADQTGVDDARRLKRTVPISPVDGKRKVYIIDECHRLSDQAKDSLLKILEEPPSFVYFILCTTMVNKVVGTMRSRAVQYHMKPLKRNLLIKLLKKIIKKEKLKVSKHLLPLIAEHSEGIPRNAMTMLESVKGMKYKKAEKLIQSDMLGESQVPFICRTLLKGGKGKWKIIKPALKEIQEDPETIRRGILGWLNNALLRSDDPKFILRLIECFLDHTYDTGKPGLLYSIALASLI